MTVRRLLLPVLFGLHLILLLGCVPATVPDNLDDTPGPPVRIVDGFYQGTVFTARIPDGWRVITSEARVPPAVIFVAPEDKALIHLMTGDVTDESAVPTGHRAERARLTLPNGQVVTTLLSAAPADWDAYYPVFEAVQASLQPPA